MRTNRIAVITVFASGLVSAAAVAAPAANELLLSGPVESVDRASSVVTVLGHQISVKDVSSYSPGHIVNVFGSVQSDGSAKLAFVQDTQSYAASGDAVLVVGVVRSVDRTSGRAILDGSSIDYTALLSNVRFLPPTVGDVIRVVGTQPNGRGVVLASQIVSAAGISGGGNALGISGGGNAMGISGGGNAMGISGGGNAMGISGGGHALGISGGGNAMGISGGGHALGISGGGNAMGISGGGNAMGISGGGAPVR